MDCLIPALRRRYDNPGDMMRCLYKYTDCGAGGTLVVEGTVHAPSSSDPWAEAGGVCEYYSHTAYTLGTWDDMEGAGMAVLAVRVSSIVEGIEATTDTITVEAAACADADEFDRRWNAAIDEVETQARGLWDETHGCAWCDADPADVPTDPDLIDARINRDVQPINPNCPVCDGCGIIL